jgi:hypothetical protein
MSNAVSLGLLAAVAMTLGACESDATRVSHREDLLAAAGFTVRPANTPERQASLTQLAPHQFVRQTHGDQVTYLYADPLVCHCLYVGDQQAYGRYRQEVFQRQIADEQQLAAMVNEQAGWNGPWDWGPWGPGSGAW